MAFNFHVLAEFWSVRFLIIKPPMDALGQGHHWHKEEVNLGSGLASEFELLWIAKIQGLADELGSRLGPSGLSISLNSSSCLARESNRGSTGWTRDVWDCSNSSYTMQEYQIVQQENAVLWTHLPTPASSNNNIICLVLGKIKMAGEERVLWLLGKPRHPVGAKLHLERMCTFIRF